MVLYLSPNRIVFAGNRSVKPAAPGRVDPIALIPA